MDNKIKFFDQTFKVLVILAACTWAIYLMLLLFAGDSATCKLGAPSQIFTIAAWTVGILTGPPVAYGLVRVLFWPGGPKNRAVYVAGWMVGVGAALFIAATVLFALAISQYGCH
jgi:hypothetical protein